MTPDEARDLLDGTTPGPWTLQPVPGHPGLRHISTGAVVGLNGIPECIPVHMDSKVGAANMTAIATVPAMLATIAGMREEWARKARIMGDTEWHNLGWCRSRAEAELTDWWGSIPRGATVEYRLVRRYVTEPEEA